MKAKSLRSPCKRSQSVEALLASPAKACKVEKPSMRKYEADLSFAKLDGKPPKFVKRCMGEARKLLSERGVEENREQGLDFILKDRDNLSKYAVTVRDLNPEGQLYADLKRLGLDASIELEF